MLSFKMQFSFHYFILFMYGKYNIRKWLNYIIVILSSLILQRLLEIVIFTLLAQFDFEIIYRISHAFDAWTCVLLALMWEYQIFLGFSINSFALRMYLLWVNIINSFVSASFFIFFLLSLVNFSFNNVIICIHLAEIY